MTLTKRTVNKTYTIMKSNKFFLLCAALMVTLCSSVFAQQVRDEKKVPEEQIPIAVRNAFGQEFNVADEDKKGSWFIYFEQHNEGSRPVAKPIAYIYRTKKQGERVEIKYDAAGKFDTARGITRKEVQTSGSN
jgi:hypothetical protein